jgi:hypothetical protein
VEGPSFFFYYKVFAALVTYQIAFPEHCTTTRTVGGYTVDSWLFSVMFNILGLKVIWKLKAGGHVYAVLSRE